MADIEQTAPFVGHRIPVSIGTEPKPNVIIFRELQPDVRSGWLNIVYKQDNLPIPGDIDAFIDALRPQPEEALRAAGAALAAVDPTSPLDLNCKMDCFLVFKLADGWNWQFASSGDCFTTKKSHGGKYSDLFHVMPSGPDFGSGQTIGDGCKLLYVQARCSDTGFKDGFNLTVELLVGEDLSGTKRRTKIIIDPDIRNPGGGGEP